MATLTFSPLTLVEQAKRIDPKGNLAAIAEVLNETNEIMEDIPFMEANDTWAHKIVRRAALPTGSFRKLNSGVSKESSRTIEVMETMAMLESYAESDKDLIDSFPDPMQARMDEAAAFIEGMGQTFVSKLLYGNADTTPEEFTGLANRMGSLAADDNVIGLSGTGSDLTSIYIVQWGPSRVFCFYPKGSPSMGIVHRDLGEETLSDSSSNLYQGYRDHFQMKVGLAVKDNRCIARLANIEQGYGTTSNIFDEDALITVLNRMPMAGRGAIIYVNDAIKTQMEIALKDKNNVNYTANAGEGLAGEPVLRFRGNRVRLVDQIVNTESAIT